LYWAARTAALFLQSRREQNLIAEAHMYQFDWSVIYTYFPALMTGLVVTLKVSIISELVAIALGLLVALCRLSPLGVLRYPAVAYIDFLRGIPVLVILLWVYYGFSILFGLNFSQMQAAVLGLGCVYSAYIAEIFRSGIQAVPVGQREAGRTLGLANWQVMVFVILPQAFRIIIPPMGNTVVSMLKDSSLVAIVAISDLMRQTMVAASETFRPFELYAATALIYYVLTFLTARIITLIERRLARLPAAERTH
jgi:polar amino acid transport system permease protein